MFNRYNQYFIKLIFSIGWILVNISWMLKLSVKHQLILVKHRLIFLWGKVNLLTGFLQEFIWLSLTVMLNGYPHAQLLLSKIITPSKNTSRLSYCNGRNVTTSKGKGKFYNYQWMFLGHSTGKCYCIISYQRLTGPTN